MTNVSDPPDRSAISKKGSWSEATTVTADEVKRFTDIAAAWWDETGDFKPLHRLNPSRLAYIRATLIKHFHRDDLVLNPFSGLSICDVGCGGGLIAEPMARMGFAVTGVDAGAENIRVAENHAAAQGLSIDYRTGTAEEIAAAGMLFDAVLALEIIEHVNDPGLFLGSLSKILRPGGALILSTLNRTLKSLAFAKIGAEYIARWVPAGTHDWRKFFKPSELARLARQAGFEPVELAGLTYNFLTDSWSKGSNLDINYMLSARKSN